MKRHAFQPNEPRTMCGRYATDAFLIEGGVESPDAERYLALPDACGGCVTRIRDLAAWCRARRQRQRPRSGSN